MDAVRPFFRGRSGVLAFAQLVSVVAALAKSLASTPELAACLESRDKELTARVVELENLVGAFDGAKILSAQRFLTCAFPSAPPPDEVADEEQRREAENDRCLQSLHREDPDLDGVWVLIRGCELVAAEADRSIVRRLAILGHSLTPL